MFVGAWLIKVAGLDVSSAFAKVGRESWVNSGDANAGDPWRAFRDAAGDVAKDEAGVDKWACPRDVGWTAY